jgi:hypothetical protein
VQCDGLDALSTQLTVKGTSPSLRGDRLRR